MRLSIGTILVYHWGYGQTNVDFFKVLRTTAKTVIIQKLGSKVVENNEDMSGKVLPTEELVTGHFYNKGSKVDTARKLKLNDGAAEFLTMDHGRARIWDGTKQYASWCH